MKRKVVTLCGSVRFWNKIQEMSERLELENEYGRKVTEVYKKSTRGK